MKRIFWRSEDSYEGLDFLDGQVEQGWAAYVRASIVHETDSTGTTARIFNLVGSRDA